MTTATLKFAEIKQLNLLEIDRQILEFWTADHTFKKSVEARAGQPPFVFYEGPPSANGMPGIHHVMARAIKDLFCRYKTMKGFRVNRKGGWDTHGLPVELGVEKSLGITKEDIGKSISIAEYNEACRKDVMKYKDVWDDLTQKMGMWIDLDDPYITFENDYIESLWHLLKKLYDKGLLYKGYTIQPFSPAAGTGLSSHELNLPGTYKEVKDTSITAQFKIAGETSTYMLAWTTTPWTLPSNTALAVGPAIDYVKVSTFNAYTHQPVTVILAKERMDNYFKPELAGLSLADYEPGQKNIPFKVISELKGKDLAGVAYEQLMPYEQPKDGDAFKVITGDFVTTDDGTGIVHIAPSFGADDLKVAKENGIGSLTLVDRQGKFLDSVTDFAGQYVKNYTDDPDYESVDISIAVTLKKTNKAFRVEKYEHSYPHCWRTDKPIIYYPLDSWFIKTSAVKEKLIELNNTINWKPKSTGTGRFGQWLENLVDWNLSRSRFWGTPLPIWRTEDGKEEICIGSVESLQAEAEKAKAAGFMESALPENLDLHRPYVDEIVLVSPSGKKMFREPDLIDVWFDSGAMPYAQWHYPFENESVFAENFPADFIAEGVDQTRGWFYTLHTLAGMLFDSVAYKNVVSNGLVLDKAGNKMSKRLGNAVDPFKTIAQYGADATRWYMLTNAQPWDNLKFNEAGIEEVQRKFFGTLFNTYSFFSLYANIDGFTHQEAETPLAERPEIDRWIISLLNTLIQEVDSSYDDYEPTKAARAIQEFTDIHLSNWYVRLCRRRFWKGEYSTDKIAAYQTLYRCMDVIARLMAPIAPFFGEFLYRNLNNISHLHPESSVHLVSFPEASADAIDKPLEERMEMAQQISSMVLSLRKKVDIKVRQPLNKIMIPVGNEPIKQQIDRVKDLIRSEVNIKAIEYMEDTEGVIVKKIKPDFRVLGKRLGPKMKAVSQAIAQMDQPAIRSFESSGQLSLTIDGETIEVNADEVEITSEDIPGWLVTNLGDLTVALDITLTEDLKNEGFARELVNRIQRLRKEKGFEVTDRITIKIQSQPNIFDGIDNYKAYICSEILAEDIDFREELEEKDAIMVNEFEIFVDIKQKS